MVRETDFVEFSGNRNTFVLHVFYRVLQLVFLRFQPVGAVFFIVLQQHFFTMVAVAFHFSLGKVRMVHFHTFFKKRNQLVDRRDRARVGRFNVPEKHFQGVVDGIPVAHRGVSSHRNAQDFFVVKRDRTFEVFIQAGRADRKVFKDGVQRGFWQHFF